MLIHLLRKRGHFSTILNATPTLVGFRDASASILNPYSQLGWYTSYCYSFAKRNWELSCHSINKKSYPTVTSFRISGKEDQVGLGELVSILCYLQTWLQTDVLLASDSLLHYFAHLLNETYRNHLWLLWRCQQQYKLSTNSTFSDYNLNPRTRSNFFKTRNRY